MKEKIFKNKKLIFGISLFIFIIITSILFSGKIDALDENIHNYVIGIRSDGLTNVMITITNICSIYAIIAISLLLLFIIKNKKTPIAIIINLIFVTLISQICKFAIQRERPIGINLIKESGYSYPSGHSMVSMAFFGFIAYLIYKNLKSKVLKALLIISIFIGIILIGFSRIYLGVHYFSDVIAGFFLSIAYLMVFIHYYKKYTIKEDKDESNRNNS